MLIPSIPSYFFSFLMIPSFFYSFFLFLLISRLFEYLYDGRRRKNRNVKPGGEAGLPHLSISASQGVHMYFLSPYSCVSITNCSDCEIIIGAVKGAVILHGCERIKLTVACRKLVIQNSLECEICLATLTASVISGDSRSLSFGKTIFFTSISFYWY